MRARAAKGSDREQQRRPAAGSAGDRERPPGWRRAQRWGDGRAAIAYRRAIVTLVTARLALDPLKPDDAAAMAGVLGDPRLFAYTGGRPLSAGELRRRFERQAAGRSPDGTEAWLNWIVRLAADRTPVGTVQATVLGDGEHRRAIVAWVIGVAWQRRGIASEAAIALVGWLGRDGIHDISAHIHPGHVASHTVAARAGLVRTDEIVDGEQVWRAAGAPPQGEPQPAG